jgi:hypothetical protein
VTARLLITTPASRPAEREWIARVLLERHLGQSVDMAAWERGHTAITCAGHDGVLTIEDGLLASPAAAWLTPASLPVEPLRSVRPSELLGRNDLPFDDVPGIYWPARVPAACPPVEPGTGTTTIPFDLFGSAFFMLTRYEECVSPVRDRHGRYPGSACLAFRLGFLQKPVVDQYAELLWAGLSRLWPGLRRPQHAYRLWLTHDVDQPYFVFRRNRLRMAALGLGKGGEDALLRRDVRQAATRVRAMTRTLVHGAEADPHFNLRAVMDIDEAHHLSATYFYMADKGGRYGAAYGLNDPAIRSLLESTHRRGHQLGLHASYGSMTDAAALSSEWSRLRSAVFSLGIEQASWGSRTHFVRWSARTGFRDTDAAGADFDTTLAYADQVGFRCGTCREYPAFDLLGGRPLRLQVRPTIAMEYSVIDPHYMGKGLGDEALLIFSRLAEECRTYGGTFTLLWHNHNLLSAPQVRLYEAVLEGCA